MNVDHGHHLDDAMNARLMSYHHNYDYDKQITKITNILFSYILTQNDHVVHIYNISYLDQNAEQNYVFVVEPMLLVNDYFQMILIQ